VEEWNTEVLRKGKEGVKKRRGGYHPYPRGRLGVGRK
jgi:hypothetical protein